MGRKLNVLVLESCKKFAVKLIDILQTMDEVNEILYAPNFDRPVNLLLSKRVNIVLCGIALTNEDVIKLNDLRNVCKPFYLLMLLDEDGERYANLSGDYFTNKLIEFEKLPEAILKGANTVFPTNQEALLH